MQLDYRAPVRPAGGSRSGVVVLGMHRSGTSCLAGSLQQRGLHLGKVHECDPYNRKGNRENDRVMSLNNAVLACSGGTWDAPPVQLKWDGSHASERDDIIVELRAGAPDAWGFKDPRALITLPFWRPALGEDVRFVGTFRHPAQVARSLQSRGGMSIETGHAMSLWRTYNERLLAYHAQTPFPLVSFDLPSADYLAVTGRIADGLGLTAPPSTIDVAFYEGALRNGVQHHEGIEIDGALLQLHQCLLDASLLHGRICANPRAR